MSDLFSRHGIEHVMSVVEDNVQWMFGDPDLEEIGSSDVSICCHSVLNDLGTNGAAVTNTEWGLIRNAVNNMIHDVREQYA